jgi:pyrroline-5-carboxylate reductase
MKIVFIGGGNMATALIGGLLRQGFPATDIVVVEPLAENRQRLGSDFGVVCLPAVDASVFGSDVLVLSIKPQQMRQALAPLAGRLKDQLVVSIAAGMRLADVSRWLGGYAKLVRSMPNTPALIGAGITGLYADSSIDGQARSQAERILGAVGKTFWVADESLMDAVTAVSASGVAYFFYFVEALREAAQAVGLPAEQARLLALETAAGAMALAANSAEDVAVLRQRVTSKGGTTEAALKSLDADDFKGAILRAVRAADARGRELGELLGKD